jgi:hypothetical protein
VGSSVWRDGGVKRDVGDWSMCGGADGNETTPTFDANETIIMDFD